MQQTIPQLGIPFEAFILVLGVAAVAAMAAILCQAVPAGTESTPSPLFLLRSLLLLLLLPICRSCCLLLLLLLLV
jgi:hypothetical protein